MAKDFYEILGVKKGSNETEIKSAYRKLALKWHPDKHKGDKDIEKKFKEINVAYETLSDTKKRQQYDTFGSTGGAGSPGGAGFGGFGGFNGGGDFSGGSSGFADIFESFFGGGMGGQSSRSRKGGAIRGNDIEANIQIKFEEAIFGCEKELEITKPDTCKHCNGKGAEPGSSIVTCKTCNGSGEIRSVRNTILGQMTTSSACTECDGEGKAPEKKCSVCHGTTRVRSKERVKIKIPAGVDNGSTIRLTGKGEAGVKGGPYGDLYINLAVESSKDFFRNGHEIHSESHVHVIEAILGSEIDIKTLDGISKIKMPAGTEDGKVFKISDKGVPIMGSDRRGDHLVKIKLDIPKKLSKKEKELYSDLAENAGIDIKKSGLFW